MIEEIKAEEHGGKVVKVAPSGEPQPQPVGLTRTIRVTVEDMPCKITGVRKYHVDAKEHSLHACGTDDSVVLSSISSTATTLGACFNRLRFWGSPSIVTFTHSRFGFLHRPTWL